MEKASPEVNKDSTCFVVCVSYITSSKVVKSLESDSTSDNDNKLHAIMDFSSNFLTLAFKLSRICFLITSTSGFVKSGPKPPNCANCEIAVMAAPLNLESVDDTDSPRIP